MSSCGRTLEKRVHAACVGSYLSDFLIDRPKFKRSCGFEIEAGDQFLVWRDCLVVFQIKSRLVDAAAVKDLDKEGLRLTSRIRKAVKQITAFRRAIRQGELDSHVNHRGVEVPFLSDRINRVYGVVVFGVFDSVSGQPLDSSVELFGGLDEVGGIPVHVFNVLDFELIIGELDTLPDLTEYLDARKALFVGGKLDVPPRERDLLSVYQTQYPVVEALLSGAMPSAVIGKGVWEQTLANQSVAFLARGERWRKSQIIDEIIGQVHTSIGYKLKDDVPGDADLPEVPGSIESYLAIVEELSGLSRVSRMQIGERFYEKMLRADTDPKGFSFFASRSQDSDAVYLFLAHRGTRGERFARLKELVGCAYVYNGTKRALGVSAGSAAQKSGSYDFILMEDVEFDNHAELLERAKAIFEPVSEPDYDPWAANDL